jgi:hypothetical protein
VALVGGAAAITATQISTGAGGNGGAGGSGGPGGAGGAGSFGNLGETASGSTAGTGGKGATGATGGAGGQGGGGRGGPSIGLYCQGAGGPTMLVATYTIGNGGLAGSPNGVPGLSQNSNCP